MGAASYYGVKNSLLSALMRSRKGIPITLCALFNAVAQRVGLHHLVQLGKASLMRQLFELVTGGRDMRIGIVGDQVAGANLERIKPRGLGRAFDGRAVQFGGEAGLDTGHVDSDDATASGDRSLDNLHRDVERLGRASSRR